MLAIFYFQNFIMILWITDRRWNEIWFTVAFHYLDQWSSWNSCSVNPYVIFWKMARNEIIREIDFFHLKCCLSLEGSTFYDGNLYHRSKLYIELLFYLLIKSLRNKARMTYQNTDRYFKISKYNTFCINTSCINWIQTYYDKPRLSISKFIF